MISGYTYIKNASSLGYPFIESILSVLPICDEFIISLGDSEDNTEKLINDINSDKIKIIHTIWEKNNLKGGQEFSRQAQIALNECKHKWVLHLQCDEVIHEDDLPIIRKIISENNSNLKVQGFLFDYIHFYGNYNYRCISPRWYRREIRLFRNNIGVKPYLDSQGFRINNKKLTVKTCNVRVFHYSRVSNPNLLNKKMKAFKSMYSEDFQETNVATVRPVFDQNGELLAKYNDSHPKVMIKRIANIDWDFNYDPQKVKLPFKYKFKMLVKKLTGYMPFEYKNYKIV